MDRRDSAPRSALLARRAVLRRRIRLLVAATITYNVVEAIIAISAGTVAGSIALIGFGLDSVIEVSSAAAVAWQFSATDPERREKVALRVIAGSFFALAAYVTVEALRTLVNGNEPERTTVGIVLVAVSVVVMPPRCIRRPEPRADLDPHGGHARGGRTCGHPTGRCGRLGRPAVGGRG